MQQQTGGPRGAAPAAPAGLLNARGSPVVFALVGAACISCSAILVQLAHTAAGTTAFFRCALALPGLMALARAEQRRCGPRALHQRLVAAGAGVFFGIDLVLWTHAIYDVGAGIATVLGNLQVLFVTAMAWAILHERPRTRVLVALPVVLGGVVLVAGLIGHHPSGDHPVAGVAYGLGTSVTYALFLLILRRNTEGLPHVAGPLVDACWGAAATALVLGLALGQFSFTMPWGAFGWLVVLALLPQTLGWLLITSSLPRLPAAVSSLLLLLQPASSLVLAAVVLSQRPTLIQLMGAVLVCGGVLVAARSGRPQETDLAPVPVATG